MILALLIGGVFGLGVALFGALLIAASYTLVGHALGDPRLVLAALLGCHLLAAAFWVAALAPLYRAAGGAQGAALLHRFGVLASAAIAILVTAGGIFAWLMVGTLGGLVTTAYGWTLLAKLGLVAGLMGLAAANKWRLVPALGKGKSGAQRHLRHSIKAEILVIAIILIATATLTSVTTPPVNL